MLVKLSMVGEVYDQGRDGHDVQGRQDGGLEETITVREPGEVLASTEVSASKAEGTGINAHDVTESPIVGEEIREEFGSNLLLASTDIDVSKDMVASVVRDEFGSSLVLAGTGVNVSTGECACNETTVQDEQDVVAGLLGQQLSLFADLLG